MNNCGIYQIRNIINGVVYVGQTTDLKSRKYKHFYDLRKNTHENPKLQNSYNKYGKSMFIFEPLIFCDSKNLTIYEQIILDSKDKVFNVKRECVESSKGVKFSEETKRKIGEKSKGNTNRLGKFHTPESIEKMRKAKLGKVLSLETRMKMSASSMGHPPRGAGGGGMSGKSHSEETKHKISLKNKGHTVSQKQRQQISDYWRKRREEKVNEN